jgi:hypothetical protein
MLAGVRTGAGAGDFPRRIGWADAMCKRNSTADIAY